jgi:hypothetical protein
VISEASTLSSLPPSGTFLHDYVRYAMRCTDAHAAQHILGGLVCLAQTLPIDFGIPSGDAMLRGNIYCLSVGPSTEARKSASLSIARNMLNAAQISNIVETPGSAEGLLELIREMPRCLLAYSEFGSFLAQTQSGYAVPIKTLLTDAYDSISLGRGLANKRRGSIENPRVSIYGASTLDFLERHTEPVDWTGGFLGRFLTIYTEKRERTYPRQPSQLQGQRELADRLQTYASIDVEVGECLGFEASTDEAWTEWYYETEKRARSSARETKAAIARAPGMALKIALILAWDFGSARTGQPWYVTNRELKYAIKLTELHIDSVLEIGDHLAPSRDLRDRLKVLGVIPADRAVSTGQIITQSKVGLKKRVLDLLATLEEEGLVARVTSRDGLTDLYVRPIEGEEGRNASNVIHLFGPPPPSLEVVDSSSSGDAIPDLDLEVDEL